jgi:hypothetical protein
MDKEMMKALEADGEKLRQLSDEDHGPWEIEMCWLCGGDCAGANPPVIFCPMQPKE